MSLCGMPYAEGDGYGEICSFWEEREVEARKPHRCCECGSEIQARERYGLGRGVYDGKFTTWHRCQSCLILAEMVATEVKECPLWGVMSGWIEEWNDHRTWLAKRNGEDPPEPFPSPREHRRRWDRLPEEPAPRGGQDGN